MKYILLLFMIASYCGANAQVAPDPNIHTSTMPDEYIVPASDTGKSDALTMIKIDTPVYFHSATAIPSAKWHGTGSMGGSRTVLYGPSWADNSVAYLDTIPIMMLCQDTSHWFDDDFFRDSIQDTHSYVIHGRTVHIDRGRNYNSWMLSGKDGYEVLEMNNDPNIVTTGIYNPNDMRSYFDSWPLKHITYLDADKKPIKNTIIVWMSKPLKP